MEGVARLWIYDLRTNEHFTLKANPLRREDLQDFVECYNPENRHEMMESEWFKSFSYDAIDSAGQGEPGHILAERREPR